MRFLDGLGNNLIVGGLGASSGGPLNSNLLLLPTEGAPALQFRSGNTSFAQIAGDPAGKLVLATGPRSWRFESSGNLTPGTSDTDYSIGGASVPLMVRGSTLELRCGPNTGVKVESNANVKLGYSALCSGSAVQLQDNYFEKEWEFSFGSYSAGKYCELYFAPGAVGFHGMIDISVTAGHGGANASGSVVKRFQLSLGTGGGFVQSTRYVAAPALTAAHFAISDFLWDANNSRWFVKIIHLTNTENWAVIRLKAQSGDAAYPISAILGILFNFPDVAEPPPLPPAPVVSYDTPVSFTGGVGGPTTGTRSPGTRAVTHASLGTSLVDYAIGQETSAMWFSVADVLNSFKWYANTTPLLTLTGGILKLGSLGTEGRSVLEFYQDGLGGSLTGLVGFDASGPARNIFLRNNSANGQIVLSVGPRAWAVSQAGELYPATAAGDYVIGRQTAAFRVSNYWGVAGDFSGNLTVGGASTFQNDVTVTGKITLNGTLYSNAAVLYGSLSLRNATSNLIAFDAVGLGPPTTGATSAGTKVILRPEATVNYAVGMETDALWFSVANATKSFKWYGGTTLLMSLANGVLDVQSGLTVGGAAPQGRYLRSNSSGAFVSSTLQPADLASPVPLNKGGTNNDLSNRPRYSVLFVDQSGGCSTIPPNDTVTPMYLRSYKNQYDIQVFDYGRVEGAVPLGGIIPFLNNLSGTPAIPDEFREANGQIYIPASNAYPYWNSGNGVVLPDLEGVTGPNPKKRFLRGSTGSGDPTNPTHSHSITFSTCNVSLSGSGTNVVTGITTPTGVAEALPPYYETMMLIRVR